MSPLQEIIVAQESINDETVQIVAVHVGNGSRVSKGDPVVEIETSKANLTLEAEHDGYIACAFKVGDEVEVGTTIARIFQSSPPVFSDSVSEPEPRPPGGQPAVEPIFSDAARVALRELNLSEDQFAGIAFVTEDLVRQFRRDGDDDESPQPEDEDGPSDDFDPASLCDLRAYLRADVFRYQQKTGFGISLRCFLRNPGFRCTWYFRTRKYLKRRPLARFIFGPMLSIFGNREARKYGIRIPLAARVGRGLLIGHWGGIWINPKAVIGENCNLNNDVSIGSAGPAAKLGHPVIGNRVFIGPGARISGDIRIGNDSVIGANSFLTKSVGRRSVVVGVPATVSSRTGSEGFINDILNPEVPSESL
ncbi:MAG: serine O-acetyltransferase [Pseudoalteromonas tetraodonis]|jgi:serine O-acetyltransferase